MALLKGICFTFKAFKTLTGMKLTLVLVLAVIFISKAQCRKTADKIANSIAKCRKKLPVGEDEVEEWKKGHLPTSENGKCFIACMMEEGKMLKGGKYLKANAIILAEIVHKNNQPMIDKVTEIIEICSSRVPYNSKECDFAFDLSQCAVDEAITMGLPELKMWG